VVSSFPASWRDATTGDHRLAPIPFRLDSAGFDHLSVPPERAIGNGGIMRKLKLQMQITVDGFVAGPEGQLDWMTWDMDEKLIHE